MTSSGNDCMPEKEPIFAQTIVRTVRTVVHCIPLKKRLHKLLVQYTVTSEIQF